MEKHGNALRYELAAAILPSRLRRIAMEQPEEVKEHAEEFRLRAGRCMSVLLPAGEQSLEIIVTVEELETLVTSRRSFRVTPPLKRCGRAFCRYAAASGWGCAARRS